MVIGFPMASRAHMDQARPGDTLRVIRKSSYDPPHYSWPLYMLLEPQWATCLLDLVMPLPSHSCSLRLSHSILIAAILQMILPLAVLTN